MNGFGTCNGRGGTAFLLPSSSLCRVAVLNKVPFVFWKSNLDFLINVTSEKNNFEKLPRKVTRENKERFTDDSERTERKGKRKSKSIVHSVGVLIGIAQNVII